ncbi:MAG: hypothetical protein KAH06_09080 [Desulfobacterales bacterium]|nr:hypothetical protein [Desulfobacterales bacterium]
MKKNMIYVLIVGFLVFIAACDDSPDVDDISGYSTVYLSADYSEAIFDSDCATFIDTDDDGLCDSPTFEEDDITILVTSTVYPDLAESVTASPVMIEQAVITYIPDAVSPAVPERTMNIGIEIPAGGSALVPVRIVEAAAKYNPSSPLYYGDVIASGTAFNYTVQITLIGTEQLTGIDNEVTTQLYLNYANEVDECL